MLETTIEDEITLLIWFSLSDQFHVTVKQFNVVKLVTNIQWLKWFCEAGGGGSPDEARLEQTPYPFQPH